MKRLTKAQILRLVLEAHFKLDCPRREIDYTGALGFLDLILGRTTDRAKKARASKDCVRILGEEGTAGT